eukprot:544322_1
MVSNWRGRYFMENTDGLVIMRNSESDDEEEQNNSNNIALIDIDTFQRIICFKFYDDKYTNIDCIIRCSYKYYFDFDGILLIYHYSHRSGHLVVDKFKVIKEARTCIVYSTGNIYKRKDIDYADHDDIDSPDYGDKPVIDEMKTFINHKYLDKNIKLSLEKVMLLISILVNIQICFKQNDSYVNMANWDNTTNIIKHFGKEIAEKHGFDIKVHHYKNKNEINFKPLYVFMQNELKISLENIEDLKNVTEGTMFFDWTVTLPGPSSNYVTIWRNMDTDF